MNIVEENWEQILNKMKLEYCSSNISYNTWIAPLTVYEVTDDTVYILVKLRASLEHIEEKYLLPFKVCIAEVTGYEYEVRACKKAFPKLQKHYYSHYRISYAACRHACTALFYTENYPLPRQPWQHSAK